MYYNDVHFNSVNTHVHIGLKTKACNGVQQTTKFKVDTGVDGNLLPVSEFFKHFPNANMNQLAKTIDPHTRLYAYNQTEIRQLGVCELLVQYKSMQKICDFFVVDFPTAIFRINDSESLKLITVHFNSIDSEISQSANDVFKSHGKGTGFMLTPVHVNTIQDDDKFTVIIKCDYSNLFWNRLLLLTPCDIMNKLLL